MHKKKLRKPIFIIGHVEEAIKGAKLPSKMQVLRYLFHRTRNLKESVHEGAKATVTEVLRFLHKVRIPTMEPRNIIPKIKSLYEEWRKLQKVSFRKTEKEQKLQEAFRENLEYLFDIAPSDVLNMLKNEEKKVFLENQRKKERIGCISTVCDLNLLAKERRSIERRHKEQERFKRYKQEGNTSNDYYSGEISDGSLENDEEEEKKAPASSSSVSEPPKKKRGTQNIITPKLAAFLDNTKLTNRSAFKVVSATVEACHVDLARYNVNKSTVCRIRSQSRIDQAEKIKQHFKSQIKAETTLIEHFQKV